MRKVELRMKENLKYETIKNLVDHNGNKNKAALKLGITLRQVNRLIRLYCEKGKDGFVHGNRNRQPVNHLPQKLTNQIINLYTTIYKDFNFSHFKDMLELEHNIKVSYGTIYKILTTNEINSPKIRKITKRKRAKERLLKEKPNINKEDLEEAITHEVAIENSHPRKQRPKYFGEVIQMDGSQHKWFGEDKTTLHLAIDGCTSNIVGGYFDTQETLFGYYTVYKQILLNYGIPFSFLTDNRTVFNYQRSNSKKDDKDVLTQFGYACKTLGVSIETSSVSEYKGLIERANGTFQGRLVNELKLKGINNIDDANKYLIDIFIPNFNKRFAIDYKNIPSVFEEKPNEEKINLILAVLSPRVFDTGSAIKYENKYYQAYDENRNLVCFKKSTKCLVINTYDKKLFVSVDDKVYKLIEYIKFEEISKNFDEPIEKKKVKYYIPPMSHPWKRASFLAQQNRAHNKHIYA